MSATKSAAEPATGERTSDSSPASAAPAPIGLVQQLGNQGLQSLLRARLMQAKLTVSHPQDSYEQEADRVAEQVMRMPSPLALRPVGVVQRLPEGERDVRRFSTASDVPTVDAATEQSIQSLSGRGTSLPESVRSYMERRFGADFSAVRVHTDTHAHGLARSVNAQAFTVGRNVVFGAGHYAPDTESGKRLLAHELTHTIQQGSAPRVVQRSPETTGNTPLALPSSLQELLDERKGPTLEQLANGTVSINSLGNAELRDALAEVEQYRTRQISSSFKGIRIDELRTALLRALSRTEQDIVLADDSPRGGKGRKKKEAKPHPKVSPRVLQHQNSSILYTNPADTRAEYDLIVEWLTSTDVTKKDRRTLELEREKLEGMLSIDRQHVSDERHMKLVRAALAMKEDGNVSAALVSLSRTIDGIEVDPEDDRIHYLYFQGERLAISVEQAVELRQHLATQLEQAALQILRLAGVELDRFKAQIEWNSDHWFRSSWAEIFEGHIVSSIHDPINEVLARLPRVAEGLRTLQEHARGGRLIDAAAALPEMERLLLEIHDKVETYIHDYKEGDARAGTTLKITAAVVAAVAVSVAAVAVAPMVAGYVGGLVGVEGLGLTGIGGTALTAVGTAIGTGTIVGLGSATVHAGVSFGWGLASGDSLAEAWASSKEEAVKGFVDGFFAGAGGGAGRVVGKALGVGTGLAFHARRAGTEAMVNATITLADTLARGGTVEQALKAAGRAAVLAIPGSLIGGGNLKRLITGTISSAGTGFAGAYYSDPKRDAAKALQGAVIAVASHVANSRMGHGQETEANAAKIGARHGEAVRNGGRAVRDGAINFAATAAIRTANMLPHSTFDGPRTGLNDDTAVTARGPESERVPTPDPVVNDESKRAVGQDHSAPVRETNTQTRAGSAELDESAPPRDDKESIVNLTEKDLQHLAAEALRRPVNDPDGKVHIYPTVEAFERAYRHLSPDGRPTRGFFNPDTGEVHLSPDATVKTGLHEMGHSVREAENQWGRRYIGDFLDEGVTDAIARGHTGQDVTGGGYKKNIAFYRVFKAALGGSPEIELAIIHGEYGAFRAKVRQLFGGSELKTFEFFNKLRGIGANAQNPVALDEAVALLEQASGKTAAELSGWQGSGAAGSSSGSAGGIERVGPFSLVGAKATVDRPRQGKVLSRRIGALIRSGVPIADADIRPLLGHLISNARAAGAARLRIVPEFLAGLEVPSLTAVVESLGGTVRPIGSIFEIDIPVGRSFRGRRERVEPSENESDPSPRNSPDVQADEPEATNEAHQTITQGGVSDAPPRGTPRYIPPTIPPQAAPGEFVPPEPRFLPPRRHVGGLGRESRSTLLDPRVPTVAGFGRDFQASVPLSHVPDVPPPDRMRRVGGFGRESEPPVPHDPNAFPTTSRRVAGFGRDPERVQWGWEVPEVPLDRWRRVGGFGRRGEPAVQHDPFGPTFHRNPREIQPVEVDGFGRGRGASESLDASEGPGANESGPLKITARALQHLAAEALRRPVMDLEGKLHVLASEQEFLDTYRLAHSGRSPSKGVAGFHNPKTGDVYLSPSADLDTAIHEIMHAVRAHVSPEGREYVGAFIDEGVTEAIVREHMGVDPRRHGYERNIDFAYLLKRILGTDAFELALLHGEYDALRGQIKQLFGGSDVYTDLFFAKVRDIGARVRDQSALDEAVAMLEHASKRNAWEWPRTNAPAAPVENSGRARIEKLGAFGFLGVKQVEKHPEGRILSRRISALARSGTEIIESDVRPFLKLLIADARAGGASRLRVYPEFMAAATVDRLDTLAAEFGGTARSIDSITEIDIPLNGTTSTSGPGPIGGATEPDASTEVRGTRSSELDPEESSSSRGGGDDGGTSGKTAQVASAGSIQELIDEAATMVHALDEGHPLRGDLERFITEANDSDRWVGKAIRAGGDEAARARHKVHRLREELAEIKRIYPDDLLQAIAHGEGPTRVDAIPLGATAEARPGSTIRSSETAAKIIGGEIAQSDPAPASGPPSEQPSVILGDGLEAEKAPPAKNDFSDDIPTRDIKPTSERHFLHNIVAQARARLSNVLGKLDSRQGVAPGEEHLSPECMSGHCGLSRRTVARALKAAGIPDERIFMNDSALIAGTGAHTFTVVEIAPGRYILIDAAFAQFTGTLGGAPRVGETILRRSGQIGATIRTELLEKGYLVLNDELADAYMKVVSESEQGAYNVKDLVRQEARLDRNLKLLIGF